MVELRVHSRSSRKDILITIERIDSGWHVSYGKISGDCDVFGNDTLIECFDAEGINYPANIGDYLQVLHETTQNTKEFNVDLHEKLKILGAWISKTEISTPSQSPFRMIR